MPPQSRYSRQPDGQRGRPCRARTDNLRAPPLASVSKHGVNIRQVARAPGGLSPCVTVTWTRRPLARVRRLSRKTGDSGQRRPELGSECASAVDRDLRTPPAAGPGTGPTGRYAPVGSGSRVGKTPRGPCPVQQHGDHRGDEGGAERNRGDLPARHAAGDDRVGSGLDRRRGGSARPVRPGSAHYGACFRRPEACPGAFGSSKRMESGSVSYIFRGPCGGLEISATISPTDLSFASSAISAWDTTPTSRFSSSTTGSRRT